MSTGARSHPPDLPNFEYQEWLGGGGFADVFLYDQLRPRRKVAVKVLRAGSLDTAGLQAFDAEANLMAKVSAHPYIVSIFGADVAPDGRPFLVMEYYPKPHFGLRARGTGLPVQEVLRVGVRVASAVETAHRAGILHRDIKPANILVNDYDRPGLTDFGIAGERDVAAVGGEGMTVAYGPPEVLGEGQLGAEVGDVYSLGATLYALLAGRAPFEMPGGDNSGQALLARTLSATVPNLGRTDVPRSLELLLTQAMARDHAHRPASAAALARALQGVEREMGLAVTEFELAGVDDVIAKSAGAGDDPDSTRVGRIQVVRPSQAPPTGVPISEVPTGLTQVRGAVEPRVAHAGPVPTAPAASDTEHRHRPPAVVEPEPIPRAAVSPARRYTAIGAGVVIAIVVALAVAVSQAGGGGGGTPTTTVVDDDAMVVADLPATPQHVAVTVEGTRATITWEAPEAKEGDWYTVTRRDIEPPTVVADDVTALTVTISDVDPTARLCFEVTANRAGAAPLAASRPACAP